MVKIVDVVIRGKEASCEEEDGNKGMHPASKHSIQGDDEIEKLLNWWPLVKNVGVH